MNTIGRHLFTLLFFAFMFGVNPLSFSTANAQVSNDQANYQCVTNRALYAATVWWYKASDVMIDNSEPWNNRLLIRRDTKLGFDKCGEDISTGKTVCQGKQVEPIKKQIITNSRNNFESCMQKTGDMFAVVWCEGCSQGSNVLNAVAGTVALAALPGNSAVQFATGVVNSALDSQGIGVTSGINEIIGYKQPMVVNKSTPIHDFSDIIDSQNIIFAATPKDATLMGSFAAPKVTNNLSADKGNSERSVKYTVQLDCFLSNGGLKHLANTDTKDTITVDFYTSHGHQASVSKQGKDIPCKAVGSDPSWHADVTGILTKIVIRTSGTDGFMIDQAKIFVNQQGRLIRQLKFIGGGGADNMKGWCLSKDPTDATRSWKNHTDKCSASRALNLEPHHL